MSASFCQHLARLALLILLGALPGWAAEALDCAACHDTKLNGSVHYEQVACLECHADVTSEAHAEKGAAKVKCGTCHEDQGQAEATDIHHRLKERVGDLAPDCQTCHGDHGILAPAKVADPTTAYCGTCHENLLPVRPFHAAKFLPDQDCTSCHDQADYPAQLTKSVHQGFACVDCHAPVAGDLEAHTEAKAAKLVSCTPCHKPEALEHRESIHGISLLEGINEAAQCWSCHGSHQVIPAHDPQSPVSPGHLPATCGKCHDDPAFVKKFSMGLKDVAKNYDQSVHAKAVARGEDAATCTTCHGVHNIRNRIQPGSSISSFTVPDTCGKCHEEIAAQYKQSIHWVLAKRGVTDAPVCNDCHSEHSIHPVKGEDHKSNMRILQDETCIRCHQDPIIARRYQFSEDKSGQYLDSYHGMAVQRGDLDAAMCVDCHGVHKILPAEHPESSINPAAITETCQKCHEGATETFAHSYAHSAIMASARSAEKWVRIVYIWLIVLVISGMIAHNMVILGYELHLHRKTSQGRVHLSRFTRNEVIQHLLLMILFTVLAITGFALKYSDFVLFRLLSNLGLTEPMRQLVHRGSGAALMILGVYHLAYLAATEGGRHLLRSLMPTPADMRDLMHNLLYHLRLRHHHPEFKQFNYIEKSEYWALVWGTLIMGLTGFLLWYPMLVGEWAPVWLIRVSELVHFYEAILASLAIMVWHLFFVIYHPKEYPMNLAWIDGQISLANIKRHYLGQYKAMISDWQAIKAGRMTEDQLDYFTSKFFRLLRKNGFDPDAIMAAELAADPELQAWLQAREQPTAPAPPPATPPA